MARDPEALAIGRVFEHAIGLLDNTEPVVRDMIESELMDVAGINRTKVSDAITAGTELTHRIARVRRAGLRRAFEYLRDNL